MANYSGRYLSDSGRFFDHVKLEVYWVDVTVGTRGNRTNTSLEEDSRYRPTIWFDRVSIPTNRQAFCSIPNRMRYALIWISDTRYLHADIPFLPGSNDYFGFFNDLAFKLKGIGKTIGLEGELINPSWLQYYA